MTYRIALFAANDVGVRTFGETWTDRVRARSAYEVRAWLGAQAGNLAEMLAPDETGFLLAVTATDGSPEGVLAVTREWPHEVTGELRRPKTKKTTRRRTR